MSLDDIRNHFANLADGAGYTGGNEVGANTYEYQQQNTDNPDTDNFFISSPENDAGGLNGSYIPAGQLILRTADKIIFVVESDSGDTVFLVHNPEYLFIVIGVAVFGTVRIGIGDNFALLIQNEDRKAVNALGIDELLQVIQVYVALNCADGLVLVIENGDFHDENHLAGGYTDDNIGNVIVSGHSLLKMTAMADIDERGVIAADKLLAGSIGDGCNIFIPK
jgi:hypothetical protein